MSQVLVSFDALVDGQPSEAEAQIDGAPESLIVLRTGDRVDAFLNICPHAGRRLDWAPGKFLLTREGLLVCAAHGASFSLPSGECVAGPCKGDSLRRVDVQVDDGEVRLPD
ncbi:Rieske (2Fe-2S) protein [Cognatilysobacter terrigena]|uniref:Rieske (2Fe-2S) protein n=1 Tax=Cognatilysobacter terrigena TaxID=2488749 RepID=UPI00105BD746|nr:Rieske 2Fe-2S domain-containing protein [Lysobacter terrigena]